MSQPAPKRLMADDLDGLQILSAAVQDAVLKPVDITFQKKARAVSLEINRFHWETANRPPFFRSRSVLRFDGVAGVRTRGIVLGHDETVLQVLSVAFEPEDAPGGRMIVSFAGGAELEIRVECIDVILMDTDKIWPAKRRPDHDKDFN